MPITSRFFGKVVPTNIHGTLAVQAAQKPALVDVGDNEDCGFRAVAAGIINNIITRPRTNQPVLIRLLARHARYFNLSEGTEPLLTPVQHFDKMLAQPDIMAQFICDLAYTLRQMAVDELCAHPEYYRGAFIERKAPLSLCLMRTPGRWIHESAIAALANVLDIPVTVNVVEAGKELQMQRHYGPDKKHVAYDEIIMQVQRNHYEPQVMLVDRFKAAMLHVTHVPAPISNQESIDSDLAVIFQRINDDDQRLVRIYEQIVHRLTTMLDAGEIKKNDLLAVYVKGMERHDYLKNAAIEHGSQRFFEDAIHNIKRSVSSPDLARAGYDKQVSAALVDALARAISLGQLDENKVFAEIEQTERVQKTMV